LLSIAKQLPHRALLIAFRVDEGLETTTAARPLVLTTDRAEAAWEREAAGMMMMVFFFFFSISVSEVIFFGKNHITGLQIDNQAKKEKNSSLDQPCSPLPLCGQCTPRRRSPRA